jgi:ribonuclease G
MSTSATPMWPSGDTHPCSPQGRRGYAMRNRAAAELDRSPHRQGSHKAAPIMGRAGLFETISGSYSWRCPCAKLRLTRSAGFALCDHANHAARHLINWSPQETRVAVVENGAVQELHIERTLERGLVGNVYLGKVARVLPGMQSPSSTSGWSARPSCTWPTCTSASRRASPHGRAHGEPPGADREAGVRGPDADGAGHQGPDRHQGRAPVHADQHRRAHAGVSAAGRPHRHQQKIGSPSARAAARAHAGPGGHGARAAAAASSCAPMPRTPPTPSWPTTSPTCASTWARSAKPRSASRPAALLHQDLSLAAARAARPGGEHTSRSASIRADAVRRAARLRQEYMPPAVPSCSTTRASGRSSTCFNIDEEIARALAAAST